VPYCGRQVVAALQRIDGLDAQVYDATRAVDNSNPQVGSPEIDSESHTI
jgi:hypothetical protein